MDVTWSDDVVDTPSPELRKLNRILHEWPSPDMFKRAPLTLRWRDLPLGIFGILDRKDLGENLWGGRSSKINLVKQNGEKFGVWGPERLLRALDHNPDATHVMNNGLVKSEFSEKNYFDFLLYAIQDGFHLKFSAGLL